MNELRKKFLTEPIIRYTMRCVAKAGQQPEQLMGEMELCAKFDVGRTTVRRAMASLIRSGHVIQLPRRRGYFSNPAFAEAIPFRIGVVAGSGFTVMMNNLIVEAFCGFTQSMRAVYYSCDFMTLSCELPAGIANEILNSAVDGLLWLSPPDTMAEAVNALAARNFPVVSIGDVHSPITTPIHYNYFDYDYAYGGEQRAAIVLRHQGRHVVYCGGVGRTLDRFRQVIREAGVVFADSHILQTVEDVERRMPAILHEDSPDWIVCDGDMRRYQALFRHLKAHPGGRDVNVILENETNAVKAMKQYPELRYHPLKTVDTLKSLHGVGKRAGALMVAMLQQRKECRNPPALFR